MKKFLAFMTIFSLLLTLAACGKKNNPDYSINTDTSQFKVGILFSGDPQIPYTNEAGHYTGITNAMESCGMNVSKQLLVEKELGRGTEPASDAINRLIKQGVNIIFGTDITFYTAMESAAIQYPQIIFAHCGNNLTNTGNFITYFGKMYQANYLNGVVAGLKSLETGKPNIGMVVNYSIEYSENAASINAFTLGVLAANPNARTYMMFLDTWSDETNEPLLASGLVNSLDCGVITQICLSPLPVQAAEKAGAFVCGYGTDMTAAAPKAHLSSAVWNWTVFYQKALEAAYKCKTADKFAEHFGSNDYYEGLKDGLVDLSPLSESCPSGAQDAIDQVKELIISGQWDVFSGVKLRISVEYDKATVNLYNDPLMNQMEEEIVAAGDPPMHDDFIRTMNYLLISVNDA